MRIEDVLKELQEGDDHHPGDQPGPAGAPPGRPHDVLWNGEIVELDRTEVIFSDSPRNRKTYDYVNGIFG